MEPKKRNKQNKTELIDTENGLVVTREEGNWGVGKFGEGGQEVQKFNYKIN